MNAAAKALGSSGIFRGSLKSLPLSKDFLVTFILLIAILISALGIV